MQGLNDVKQAYAERTNPDGLQGTADEVLAGADVFIGLSVPGAVSRAGIERMADDAIVFAMANPTPEIAPEDLPPGKVAVVATGRSDYPNQINNVLAFPGVFRGALDVRATTITEGMKVAAGHAIASVIADDELGAGVRDPERLQPRRDAGASRRPSPRRPSGTGSPADASVGACSPRTALASGLHRRSDRVPSTSLGACPTLLVVQRLERVELRRAARREDRGDDADDDRGDREDDRPASSGTRSR